MRWVQGAVVTTCISCSPAHQSLARSKFIFHTRLWFWCRSAFGKRRQLINEYVLNFWTCQYPNTVAWVFSSLQWLVHRRPVPCRGTSRKVPHPVTGVLDMVSAEGDCRALVSLLFVSFVPWSCLSRTSVTMWFGALPQILKQWGQRPMGGDPKTMSLNNILSLKAAFLRLLTQHQKTEQLIKRYSQWRKPRIRRLYEDEIAPVGQCPC